MADKLFPEFEMYLSGEGIAQSWEDDNALVRYLPVARGIYIRDYSSVSMLSPAQPMTTANYHPFLHLKSIIERIFSNIGYSIHSQFINDTIFNSHISGRFPEPNVSHLIDRMDFRAGRFAPASTTANDFGQVSTNANYLNHSLGNLVETASATEQRNGIGVEGVYDNGGCISVRNDSLCFTPKSSVVAAMRYRLSLTTAYRIASRTRLAGFDTLHFGTSIHQFGLSNPFQDRREAVGKNTQYRVVVFGASASDRWRLVADTNPTNTIVTFSSETAIATTPSVNFPNLRLQKYAPATMQYSDYAGDWAMYDGHVAYEGVTDVELDIVAPPHLITPSSPKYFNDIIFAGAWAGAKLTLRNAIVTPIFEPHPTEHTTIGWADIAAHKFDCRQLLESLYQMFNLSFYIDRSQKVIYIEPDEYYRGNAEKEWTSKIELSKPLVISPPTGLGNKTIKFGYRTTDGATNLLSREQGIEFGAWKTTDDNYFAKSTQHTIRNLLFAPTANYNNQSSTAPSALLMMCGDVKQEWDSSLNFEPKIVRYEGLRQLPTGQHWGWPTFGYSYPYAAFHAPSRWTLCMENRDRCEGLNRFWHSEIETQKSSHLLTAYLHIDAIDIEALRQPNELQCDWRGRFKFLLDGEWSHWRLTKIENYSPDEGIAKCYFTQIVN